MYFAFLIAAAAVDPGGLSALAAADARLVAIGRRLARGGAGLCGGTVANPGWTIEDAEQFAPPLRETVRTELRIGAHPTIVAVEPGSAAARAGIRAGDEVLAIGDAAIPDEPAPRARRDRQEQIEAATAAGLAHGPVRVSILRDGKPSKATVAPEPGCTTEFLIGRGRGLRSASSDGARITVSAEIVEFAQSDDELALVMAHELSHNILGHNRGYAAQRIAGTDLSGARGRDHEREADRWALYLLARAGYDPGVAPGFWRRWGPRTDLGILGDGSHPDWRDRAQRAEAELERIRAQQAAGEVPIP